MTTLSFKPPLQRVCLLRLSAIGDTCHALAALRAFQAAWPETRFTWIIGKLEAKLMTELLPEIEFIIFDKGTTLREWRRLRTVLRGRRFDLLLDMQLSFRASMLSRLVDAPIKLGFDRQRARELQWLFTNAQIEPATSEHVLDSFMGFARACGITPKAPHWDVPLPPGALDYARRIITDQRPTLLISPCSSHAMRNWPAERYAAVADHAAQVHHMHIVLVGGRSSAEAKMGAAIIAAAQTTLVNQIGKDTLPQLLGLMSHSTVLLSPDSGPAHMASMVGLPVIGLYAATNPQRAGPYYSRQWCVDKYDQAARKFLGKPAAQIPWTTKIERPGVMDLIAVSDATEKLDALILAQEIR
ncbi:MAG TPA: glycosyltransferase family 9 protein [Steroidobacteraceae bacterium]|jgi:heptosyltransferase I|nr:glycosyltransferase family 9 protein [Steroidobacteraceae bacterium]